MGPVVVFHSVEAVLEVLNRQQFQGNDNVKHLLDIYYKLLESSKKNNYDEKRYKYPFIVIEGLDKSGKGALTKGLAEKLKAETCNKLREYVLQMKDSFASDELLQDAFYALLNYIVALQASILVYERPVVVDKYWHYTTAFSIARSTYYDDKNENKVPRMGDEVYNWPPDLLKPDMVLFLSIRERNRMKRYLIENTGDNEEVNLKKDKDFTRSVLLVYFNIKGPVLESVDANLPNDYILNEAIDKIKPFLPERLILSIMYGQ